MAFRSVGQKMEARSSWSCAPARWRSLGPPVLRWDGRPWTPHVAGDLPAHVWPWPNGILRLDDVATRWDGTTLRVVEPEIKVLATWGTGRAFQRDCAGRLALVGA